MPALIRFDNEIGIGILWKKKRAALRPTLLLEKQFVTRFHELLESP